jgi:NAD(P)-dependent dehydrogenase (short-subunit alcohol dehydrogenase family)
MHDKLILIMDQKKDGVHAYDFTNKVALVTGGTGALGSTITRSFVACKANVISTYLLDKKVDQPESHGESRVHLIRADVTKEEDVKKLISTILRDYSKIDILVNTVGGYIGGKSVAELEESEWDLMMNINLKSAYLLSKHVIPTMVAAKNGKIIHISSKTGLKAAGYDSAYAASKAGLVRFVDSLAQEVKEFSVNVNCIMPSIIDTKANRAAMPTADFGKWLKPLDLANVVLFLCSEDAKVITGAAISTCGFG